MPKPPKGYTANELDRDNPYNAWMFEDNGQYEREDPEPAEIEKDENGDEIEAGYCLACSGTGEGRYDGSRCSSCRGTGEQR